MDKSLPRDGMAPDSTHPGGRFGGRRRRFVVDARYQLRSGILVGIIAIVLLVVLNASMLFQGGAAKGAAAAVRPLWRGHDGTSLALLLLGSAVFLGGAIFVGVLESHKTAGAAFAIRRAVDAIRDGRPQVRVELRRGDNLQDLAKAINRLAETVDAERLRRS